MKRQLWKLVWLISFYALVGQISSKANTDTFFSQTYKTEEETVVLDISLVYGTNLTVFDLTSNKEVTVSDYKAQVVKGHKVKIQAEGLEGRVFNIGRWWKTGDSDRNNFNTLPLELTADTNLSFSMTFDYILSFSVKGSGGTIKGYVVDKSDPWNPYDSEIQTKFRFFKDNKNFFKFKALPHEGYKLKAWYLNGEIQDEQQMTYCLNNPKISANVEVEFEVTDPLIELKTVSFNISGAEKIKVFDKDNGDKPITIVHNKLKISKGHTIEISAEGNDGKDFVNSYWKLKDNLDSIPITTLPFSIKVDDDIIVKINFDYTVKFVAKGKGGKLTGKITTYWYVEGEDETKTSTYEIESGSVYNPSTTESISFVANPDEGHKVKAWYNNHKLVANNNENIYEIKSVSKSVYVEVEFERIAKHSVSLSIVPKTGAKTSWIKYKNPADNAYTDAKELSVQVNDGANIMLGVTPNSKYSFDGFYIDEKKQIAQSNSNNSHTLEIVKLSKDVKIDAKFVGHLSFSVVSDKGGFLNVVSDDKENLVNDSPVENGKKLILTAIPNKNYQVKRWIINDVDSISDEKLYQGNILKIMMSETPLNIKVEFEEVKKALIEFSTSNPSWGMVSAYNISTDPKLSIESGDSVKYDTELEFEVNLNKDVKLINWSINNSQVEKNEESPLILRTKLTNESVKDGKLSVIANLFYATSVNNPSSETPVYFLNDCIVINTKFRSVYKIYDISGRLIASGMTRDVVTRIPVEGVFFVVKVNNKIFKLISK